VIHESWYLPDSATNDVSPFCFKLNALGSVMFSTKWFDSNAGRKLRHCFPHFEERFHYTAKHSIEVTMQSSNAK